ncbi:hypothetical protein BGW36DRAFT_364952 [Talaromyces proteolyticus]|uniref:Uncharacterized protein n=1 Tax=Talaromyces proteolyticus TaxID=1131652 RepID=A0AAD4KKE4_9EURO|nr:uncharacterized protein BGW36DRAFT_364952 [Talaromyces proteolyticus]KAH8690229.1 hypothetical protein BGW36DRAFT_364952 [Talaromyces proteolyticus]
MMLKTVIALAALVSLATALPTGLQHVWRDVLIYKTLPTLSPWPNAAASTTYIPGKAKTPVIILISTSTPVTNCHKVDALSRRDPNSLVKFYHGDEKDTLDVLSKRGFDTSVKKDVLNALSKH